MGMIDVVGYHHENPVIGYCMGKIVTINSYRYYMLNKEEIE